MYFDPSTAMTYSLEEISDSHNIKDYKLEFNKVSLAVTIKVGPHYSKAYLFIYSALKRVDSRAKVLKMVTGSQSQVVVS
jgi:hypothetical protein